MLLNKNLVIFCNLFLWPDPLGSWASPPRVAEGSAIWPQHEQDKTTSPKEVDDIFKKVDVFKMEIMKEISIYEILASQARHSWNYLNGFCIYYIIIYTYDFGSLWVFLKSYFSPSPSWCEGCFIHWQRKTIGRWKSVEVVPNFLHVCLLSSHKFQSNFKPPKQIHLNKSQHIFGCVFGESVFPSVLFCCTCFFWGGEKRGRVSRWSPVPRCWPFNAIYFNSHMESTTKFHLRGFGSQSFIHLFFVCLRRVPQRFVSFFFFKGSSKRGLLA